MPQEQLLDYIKKQIVIGVSILDIKNALVSKGWKEEDVNKAIDEVNKIPVPEQKIENNEQKTFQYPNFLKSKKAIIIFSSTITLLTITLGVLGYYFYSQSSPDFIYKRAVIKTLSLKNIEFEVKGDISNSYGSYNVSFTNSGKVQVGDSNKDSKIKNTIEVQFPKYQPLPCIYGGDLNKIVVELFFTNNEAYLNAPRETKECILGYGYKSVGSKWIKVDKQTFENLESYDVGNLKKLNDLLFNLKDVEIKYTESEKNDKIENLKYSYKIPRKTTDKLLDDFIIAYNLGDPLDLNGKEQFHQAISNGFIWVNKKDTTISKIVPTIPPIVGSNINIEYNLKSFGKDLKLEAPLDFISFEDLNNLMIDRARTNNYYPDEDNYDKDEYVKDEYYNDDTYQDGFNGNENY